jgi:hypothetical protein
LTKVTPTLDALLNKRVVEIEWAAEDALPFSLCLSARLPSPDCSPVPNVSIARGNVVLVDHGRRVEEGLSGNAEPSREFGECACEGSVIDSALREARRMSGALKQFPITSAQPLPAGGPASVALIQDPRLALPQIVLRETDKDDASPEELEDFPAWYPRYDLLDSNGDDRHFVAETDDEGRAYLRFGDGELGHSADASMSFEATYRVGNGPGGNVGRDMINYVVLRRNATSGHDMLSAGAIKARNPLPAQGGNAPEPVAEVKLFAPGAFRTRLERAITAEDYAELAQRNAKIQRAAADLCWTGSWYEMRVAIDPAFTEEVDEKLLQEINGYLHRYRRVGHDVAVVPAHYVPLRLAMDVCVLPHYARGHVKAELLKILGSDQLEGGKRGFFHPDNLTFGDSVYVSQLVAAAMAVEGVETVRITRLERLDTPAASSSDPLVTGVLPLGPMEIAQLDNDPSFPENGVLTLTLKGGR